MRLEITRNRRALGGDACVFIGMMTHPTMSCDSPRTKKVLIAVIEDARCFAQPRTKDSFSWMVLVDNGISCS